MRSRAGNAHSGLVQANNACLDCGIAKKLCRLELIVRNDLIPVHLFELWGKGGPRIRDTLFQQRHIHHIGFTDEFDLLQWNGFGIVNELCQSVVVDLMSSARLAI